MGYNSKCGVILLAASVTLTFDAAEARAAMCDSFSADGGSNVVIVGEATNYFWYQGQKLWYGVGHLGVCWRNSIGNAVLTTFPDCDTGSADTDYVYVSAGAGNDVVWPNSYSHDCSLDTKLWPFDETLFEFFMVADGGSGSDTLLGTEHGDELRSNVYGSFPNLLPADSAEDFLCGYGGADTLLETMTTRTRTRSFSGAVRALATHATEDSTEARTIGCTRPARVDGRDR